MTRQSGLLIGAGTTAVIIALVALWSAIQDDPAIARPTEPAPAAPGGTSAATPSPSPSHAPSTTAARPSHTPASSSGAAPALRSEDVHAANTPALPEEPLSKLMENNDNLELGAPQLRAQAQAVEPLVRECVAKAAAAGSKPTGTAMLTYIVEYRGDKVVVADPGIDGEKTTLQQDSLLDCLANTATAMKFTGLPRRAKAIYVTREVTLEAGTLANYRHVAFSYLR